MRFISSISHCLYLYRYVSIVKYSNLIELSLRKITTPVNPNH